MVDQDVRDRQMATEIAKWLCKPQARPLKMRGNEPDDYTPPQRTTKYLKEIQQRNPHVTDELASILLETQVDA